MRCVSCGAVMPLDDSFCEECGTALTPACDGGPPEPVVAALPDCPKCGAGPDELDEEGYCAQCGFRRRPHERDHVEILLAPVLAGVSDRGHRHQRNEDYLAMSEKLIVVCDGVSSSQDAMEASKAAATAAAEALKAGKDVKAAVAAAHQAVAALPAPRKDMDPPSTTIVLAALNETSATIAWAGDSRAYWIAPGASRELTADDSWMNEVVTAGEMTAEEAEKSENAHAITKWLGGDVAEVEPSVMEFAYPGNGALLLCSDGLWNYAPTLEEMESLVGTPEDAAAAARLLVDFANGRGGKDNVTAALYLRR